MCDEKKCTYSYKRGKHVGKTCDKVAINNNNNNKPLLCKLHHKNLLSIYKPNFKNKLPIECVVCTEPIEINKCKTLKCGHIVHFFCICKYAAMKSNIHDYSMKYLIEWENKLFTMAQPFIQCPLCRVVFTNKSIIKYWEKTYLDYVFLFAHKSAFKKTISCINLLNNFNYKNWINGFIKIVYKIKKKYVEYKIFKTTEKCQLENTEFIFTGMFDIFTCCLESQLNTPPEKNNQYLFGVKNINICLGILKYLQMIETLGPTFLKSMIKNSLKTIFT